MADFIGRSNSFISICVSEKFCGRADFSAKEKYFLAERQIFRCKKFHLWDFSML